jgi:hypothetical protein
MEDDILTTKINEMQRYIKEIIMDHNLDIVSLGVHITKALEEAGSPRTFKLITMEEAKKWKEELQKQ